jgi:hypothetical protein
MCGQRHGYTFIISRSGTDEMRIGVNYIFSRKKIPYGKAKSQYGMLHCSVHVESAEKEIPKPFRSTRSG